MKTKQPALSLGETINFLQLYIQWMQEYTTMPPDETLRQFQELLESCHIYLAVYRDSLQSLTRIKDRLETLRLEHEKPDQRYQ